MGYGYGVLNNWRDGRDEEWFAYGPYCETRRERFHAWQPWTSLVRVELRFLTGKTLTAWIPVEDLGRTLWRARAAAFHDYDALETTTQRFDWLVHNTFIQAEMP